VASKVRTLRIRSNSLEEAEVAFISLVKRPANRVPFRILKSEDPDGEVNEEKVMIHLKNLLHKDERPDSPYIAAVSIRKEDLEALTPKLKEAGVNMEKGIEDDGVLIFKQADYDPEEVIAFKPNDDVLLLISGIRKAFDPFPDSLSFMETAGAATFVPGFGLATEAMLETVRNVLRSASSPGDAKEKMRSVLKEFSTFVLKMADNLPEVAFKFEDLQLELSADAEAKKEDTDDDAAKKAKAVDAGKEGDGDKVVEKDDGKDDTKAEDKAEGGTNDSAKKADEKGKSEDKVEKKAEDETKDAKKGEDDEAAAKEAAAKKETSDDDMPEWAKNLTKTVKDELQGVKDEVAQVKKTAEALDKRVDSAEETSDKAQKAVKGTLLHGAEVPDESLGTRSRVTRTRKDADPDAQWGGILDGLPGMDSEPRT